MHEKPYNLGFTDKAPSPVINKDKTADFTRDIAKLKDNIEKIKVL